MAERVVLSGLGWSSYTIWPIGAVLLIFSVCLIWKSNCSSVPDQLIKGVIAGDWTWVLALAAVLLLPAGMFSIFGVFLILDIAAVVAVFAIIEALGLRRVAAGSARLQA